MQIQSRIQSRIGVEHTYAGLKCCDLLVPYMGRGTWIRIDPFIEFAMRQPSLPCYQELHSWIRHDEMRGSSQRLKRQPESTRARLDRAVGQVCEECAAGCSPGTAPSEYNGWVELMTCDIGGCLPRKVHCSRSANTRVGWNR